MSEPASDQDQSAVPHEASFAEGTTDHPLIDGELDGGTAREVVAEIRAVAESRGDDDSDADNASEAFDAPVNHGSAAKQQADSEELDVEDLRDAWPVLDLEERSDGLRILARQDAEEFFIALPAASQSALLMHWKPGHRRQWARLLEPDDAADVIQEADEQHRSVLLALLDEPTRKEVQALLAYAEDEAGGLMSTRYARLRQQMTADEAISYLRRQARDRVETIYDTYVLDAEQRLLGVVSFRDLFAAPPTKTVDQIMDRDAIRASEGTDQEALSRLFAEHDLMAIPVVDDNGCMKGIVTVDDIVDVVQEEATEDIQKFGGMQALETSYLQSTVRQMVQKRGVWLAILVVAEMLTTTAMGFFEKQMHTATILAIFIPLIISGGGNSGSQASTLVIRAMALGELRPGDWWRVIRKELVVGSALGLLLAVIVGIRVLIWGSLGFGGYGPAYGYIAATVALSIGGVVLFGAIVGSMLPFLLRKLGADPASASGPFVATLVDVTGIVIYFTVASLLLSGIIL
jgi:magnesium transporter